MNENWDDWDDREIWKDSPTRLLSTIEQRQNYVFVFVSEVIFVFRDKYQKLKNMKFHWEKKNDWDDREMWKDSPTWLLSTIEQRQNNVFVFVFELIFVFCDKYQKLKNMKFHWEKKKWSGWQRNVKGLTNLVALHHRTKAE